MKANKPYTFYTYHIKPEYICDGHIKYTMERSSTMQRLYLDLVGDPEYVEWLKFTLEEFHKQHIFYFQILTIRSHRDRYNWAVIIPMINTESDYDNGVVYPPLADDPEETILNLIRSESTQFRKWEAKKKQKEYFREYFRNYNRNPEKRSMLTRIQRRWVLAHIEEYREYQKLYQRWYRYQLKYGDEDEDVISRKAILDEFVEQRAKVRPRK